MHNPNFASGPCSKRPAWSLDALKDAAVGRSHRSALGKEKINLAVSETKRILGIPENYLVGVMPASDTGAFEAAMLTNETKHDINSLSYYVTEIMKYYNSIGIGVEIVGTWG